MDAVFLRKNVGPCLATCLAEVAEKRPQDPIEYIGQWLKNYLKENDFLKQRTEEETKLAQEKAEFDLEQERKASMKLEADKLTKLEEEAKQTEEKDISQVDSTSKLPTLVEGEEPK